MLTYLPGGSMAEAWLSLEELMLVIPDKRQKVFAHENQVFFWKGWLGPGRVKAEDYFGKNLTRTGTGALPYLHLIMVNKKL